MMKTKIAVTKTVCELMLSSGLLHILLVKGNVFVKPGTWVWYEKVKFYISWASMGNTVQEPSFAFLCAIN